MSHSDPTYDPADAFDNMFGNPLEQVEALVSEAQRITGRNEKAKELLKAEAIELYLLERYEQQIIKVERLRKEVEA